MSNGLKKDNGMNFIILIMIGGFFPYNKPSTYVYTYVIFEYELNELKKDNEFIKNYSFRYSPLLILKTIIFFLPFVALLGLAAFRAVFREMIGNNTWEKTTHLNIQRNGPELIEEA